MHVGVALFLTVAQVASPGEAVDAVAIMAKINAADPALSSSPAPIEELKDVAELVEQNLTAAVDLDEVAALLPLVGTARELAYARTHRVEHLCCLILAAQGVLARPRLSADLRAEASASVKRANERLLKNHPGAACASVSRTGFSATVALPPARLVSERREGKPMIVAGGVLLGVATALGLGLAGVRVHRGRAVEELAGIRFAVDGAGGKTREQDERIQGLQGIDAWTRGASVSLAVAAITLGAVGGGLIAA